MSPIKKILLPVDLTSDAAAVWAIQIARRCNAEITFLHVTSSYSLTARLLFFQTAANRKAHITAVPAIGAPHEGLTAFLQKLPLGDVRHRHMIVKGSILRQILQQIDTLHPDLLIQGTKIHAGLNEWTLGGVAWWVLRKARCPVITVKQHPLDTPQTTPFSHSLLSGHQPHFLSPSLTNPLSRILYLTNFGEGSYQALPYAAAIAQRMNAELFILHVLNERSRVAYPPGKKSDTIAEEKLASLLREAKTLRPGLMAFSFLSRGLPEREIAAWMNAERPDLVVIGNHGPEGRGLVSVGQFTERILRISPCPVLTNAISTEGGQLEKRYRKIFKSLTPEDLIAFRDQQPDSVGEDLFRSRTIFRASGLFLKCYSVGGLKRIFEEYGIFDLLRGKGFQDLEVTINIDDPYRQRLRVFHAGVEDERHSLIDMILREGFLESTRDEATGSRFFPVLMVEWLSMQNPDAAFEPARPPLPGQKYPGLGLSRQILELICLIGERIGKDGVAIHPKYYHAALLYHRRFMCYNPIQEGQLVALVRDMEDRNSSDVSWAICLGCLRSQEQSTDPLFWEIDYQVSPLTSDLRHYFTSDRYRSLFWNSLASSSFHIDWRLFAKRFSEWFDSKGSNLPC